jgi:hypothetical protein
MSDEVDRPVPIVHDGGWRTSRAHAPPGTVTTPDGGLIWALDTSSVLRSNRHGAHQDDCCLDRMAQAIRCSREVDGRGQRGPGCVRRASGRA